MNIEQVKLSRVKVNEHNPRSITRDKFQKLINSILVLPKMLELRPIVVDGKMSAIGGNMRTNALREIAKMNIEQIADRLTGIADFVAKTEGERKTLIEYWNQWLEQPTALIINASSLSAEEKKQFVIKDNVSFGTWDFDALANQWDNTKLNDWGMDVWNTSSTSSTFGNAHTPCATGSGTQQLDPSEEDDALNLDEFFAAADEENNLSHTEVKELNNQTNIAEKSPVYCPHCGKNIYEKE